LDVRSYCMPGWKLNDWVLMNTALKLVSLKSRVSPLFVALTASRLYFELVLFNALNAVSSSPFIMIYLHVVEETTMNASNFFFGLINNNFAFFAHDHNSFITSTIIFHSAIQFIYKNATSFILHTVLGLHLGFKNQEWVR
jgi:hypothetical protein